MSSYLDLILGKLEAWARGFFKLLPNLALSILVLIFFFVLARYVRKLSFRFFQKISRKQSISGLLSSILYFVILAIGLFICLGLLHLEKTISSLLAGAGIIGLALGFAFQDLTANFISGVFIILRKPFEVGHLVDTNGFIGIIEEIQLRSTAIRTVQGLHITLPNKDIFQKPITNYSLSNERRFDLQLKLPSKANLEGICNGIQQSLSKKDLFIDRKKIDVYCTNFDGEFITLEVWAWIDNHDPEKFVEIKDKMVRLIFQAFLQQEVSK